MHGPPQGGFELRVCKELPQDPYEVLPPRWVEYIQQRRKQSDEATCVIA